ncbi:Transcription factor SPEECHLESS [Acorus calamus]|uniref:Transcription factor SPEECHLESS n=1 Tax=Acorus calamus TaxID=4465 RepID=A0AAV9CCS2_ACOCL|nr:Transcription factor SPEECHLESS [Acorus calamus]
MCDSLSDFFDDPSEFGDSHFAGPSSPDSLFSIFNTLEPPPSEKANHLPPPLRPSSFEDVFFAPKSVDNPLKSTSSSIPNDVVEGDNEASSTRKKLKFTPQQQSPPPPSLQEGAPDGPQRTSHITVERNRRKQMNENLSVLRSLMPCFYVKRGDQASIIGGVVEFIKELQQLLQSLEAKKQRKVYSDVLSPRPLSSPRSLPLSPRPPLSPSPRLGLPISPRTPQPGSPYKPRQVYIPPTTMPSTIPSLHHELSPTTNAATFDNVKELGANSKSPMADVEVKFSGSNVLLKTASRRIPGQALRIITAIEGLSLEILHVNISTVDDTMLNSFTIKIGIECELSAEELAHEIQQTFT